MTARLITILESWLIKAGPSREELFDCLRLFNEHRHIEFTLQAGMEDCDPWNNPNTYCLKAMVHGISTEDGSGHSWTLRVSIYPVEDQLDLAYQGPIELYYHDKNRRGVILSDLRPSQATV
jgi:hypothetical protein